MTRTTRLFVLAVATLATTREGPLRAQSHAPETWGERAGYTVVAGYELVPSCEGLRLRPDWSYIGEY